MTTTIDRRTELLRRGGIDPLRLDRRSLGEIMNDEIPYARWARQEAMLKRLGFSSYHTWVYRND